MEFFVTLTDTDLITLKQKLTEQDINYEVKMLTNRLWMRNTKNNYIIFVKNKIEVAKKIIGQS